MKITQEQLKQATEEVQRGRATEFYDWIDNFGTKNLIRDIYRDEPADMEEALNILAANSTEEEKITNTITYLKHNRKRILVFLDPNSRYNALILDLSQLEDIDVISKLKIFTKYGYQLEDKGNTLEIKKKGKESEIDFKIYSYNTEINEILKQLPELFKFDELINRHCYAGKYYYTALATTRDIIKNNVDILNIYTSFFPEEKSKYDGYINDLEESLNTDLVYNKFKNYILSAGSKEQQKQRLEETLGIKTAELKNPEELKTKKLTDYQIAIENHRTPEELFITFKMANMVEAKANQLINLATKLR